MPFIIENRDQLKKQIDGAPTFAVVLPTLDRAFHAVGEKLDIPQMVQVNAVLTNQSLGFPFQALALATDRIAIKIDQKIGVQPDFDWQAYLTSGMLHEGHHVARMVRHDCSQRLENAVVAEGLATNFEQENGAFPFREILKHYSSPRQLAAFARQAPSEYGVDGAILGGLFYDKNQSVKPALYALGHAVVRSYLAETGQTAAAAVHVPAEEVLPHLHRMAFAERSRSRAIFDLPAARL